MEEREREGEREREREREREGGSVNRSWQLEVHCSYPSSATYLEMLQLSVFLFSLLLIVVHYCCETVLFNLQIAGVKKPQYTCTCTCMLAFEGPVPYKQANRLGTGVVYVILVV